MLGYAYQLGGVPIPSQAIERAIELNDRSVERNLTAFRLGRIAANYPKALEEAMYGRKTDVNTAQNETLEEIIHRSALFLTNYQSNRLARRYQKLLNRVMTAEASLSSDSQDFSRAVAHSYRKVLAYKDEYEVARLLVSGDFREKLRGTFKPGYKLRFHLAPPILSKIDIKTQRPQKREFGSWMIPVFHMLSSLKVLRGTVLDPFQRSADRRLERRLIRKYEASIEMLMGRLSRENLSIAIGIAEIPMEIRGYGPVKAVAAAAAEKKEEALWKQLSEPDSSDRQVAA